MTDRATPHAPPHATPQATRPLGAPRIEAVCIGASAGGVDALLAVLGGMPASFKLPVVIVLHLPEGRDSVLADVFQHHLTQAVREARDKEVIERGTIYFAAPGYHLLIERDRSFSLSCDAPVNHSRPSIDLLFESAADAWGAALCALLLTGANNDGAQGLDTVARAGGLTAVQDPAEARIATMPEAALRLNPTHASLSLADIRELLIDMESQHA